VASLATAVRNVFNSTLGARATGSPSLVQEHKVAAVQVATYSIPSGMETEL
jgi:hypothetical protein